MQERPNYSHAQKIGVLENIARLVYIHNKINNNKQQIINSYLHLTNDSYMYMTSNETDQQTIDGSKTAKQQPTNHHNFYVSRTNPITTKLDPRPEAYKYHHLTMTLHLTLKMTTAQVVEMSVTNNSLSKDYPHPEDHDKPITNTPGFKPFTKISIPVFQYPS